MSVENRNLNEYVTSGIESFKQLVDILRSERTDSNDVSTHAADRAQSCVNDIYENFFNAKEAYEDSIDELQRQIEELTFSISSSVNENKNIENDIMAVDIEIEELSQTERDRKNYLHDCETFLNEKKHILEKARMKLQDAKKNRKIVAGAGVGVSAIPLGGWVMGTNMIALSFTVLEQAIKNGEGYVNDARAASKATIMELQKVRNEISELNEKIKQKNEMLHELTNKQKNLECEKDELLTELEEKCKIQGQLNRIFTFVSTTFSRARCLKKSTENYRTHWAVNLVVEKWNKMFAFFYRDKNYTATENVIDLHFVEQLVTPMKDLVEHLGDEKSQVYLRILRDVDVVALHNS